MTHSTMGPLGPSPTREFSWLQDPGNGDLPGAFLDVCRYLFEPAGFAISRAPKRETESNEYGAVQCGLSGRSLIFRQAKTTPTKIGQFVTLWKRATPQSEIAPFDRSDDLELCVIASFDDTHHGVFIFKPDVLAQKGILSVGGKGGKRAFRVYAPWIRPTAKQAIQTQTWQTRHFVDFADMEVAVAKVAQLMGEK